MTTRSTIGSCDCCERTNVPLSRGEVCGIETYACHICSGDGEIDPYGEMDDCPRCGESVNELHKFNLNDVAHPEWICLSCCQEEEREWHEANSQFGVGA